jgi:hypothetical protein
VNYQLWKLLSSGPTLGLLVLAVVLLVGGAYAVVVWLRRKGSWFVNLVGVVVAIYAGGLAWWHFMTLVDCGRPVPRLDAELRRLQHELNAVAAPGGAKVELCSNRLVLHVRVRNPTDRHQEDALLDEVRQRRQGSLKTTVVTYYAADGLETREERF